MVEEATGAAFLEEFMVFSISVLGHWGKRVVNFCCFALDFGVIRAWILIELDQSTYF